MISLFLYLFGLSITLGAVCMAANSDVRYFRIPNIVSVLVLIGFLVSYTGIALIPGDHMVFFYGLKTHIFSIVVMFLLTLILFFLRVIGAGDAKFASALAIWLPVHPALMMFIFYASLVGGVMGILTIILHRLKPIKSPKSGTWLAAAQEGQNRIPYGLALSLGFILTLAVLHYFNITEIINVVENSE